MTTNEIQKKTNYKRSSLGNRRRIAVFDGEIYRNFRLMKHAGGDRIMAQVLAAMPTAGLEAVLVAVDLVVQSGALSAEHVLNVVARLNAEPVPDSAETALALKEPPLATQTAPP